MQMAQIAQNMPIGQVNKPQHDSEHMITLAASQSKSDNYPSQGAQSVKLSQ
jgi:hypothetical protein